MSDISPHLLLPYILAAQAQKHVTHNEALRLLDAVVQLSVLDRDLTAPPALPADGDRFIVASGATGLWAGWDLNVTTWVDSVWMRLVPRPGWLAWIADEATVAVWNGAIWKLVGVPQDVSDAIFSLVNDPDPTKRALFSLSGISTATTRTFTLPNASSELAILAGTQTFSGNKTFSGTLTASGTVTVSSAAAARRVSRRRDRAQNDCRSTARPRHGCDPRCLRQPHGFFARLENMGQFWSRRVAPGGLGRGRSAADGPDRQRGRGRAGSASTGRNGRSPGSARTGKGGRLCGQRRRWDHAGPACMTLCTSRSNASMSVSR